MGSVQMKIQDAVATITISNPEKMNCMDMTMLKEFDASIRKIKAIGIIRVIKVQGAGDKAFSTGANLNEFKQLDQPGIAKWIKYGNQLFNELESLPIPSVAIINGYALGGGFELALACDLRIATYNSNFAFPELKHGWIPGWGGLTRLRRLAGESRAKQLILLGEMIDATSAHEMGIINKLCSVEELNQVVEGIINHLKGIDPLLLEITKNALMDDSRSTTGNDLLLDMLTSQYAKKGN